MSKSAQRCIDRLLEAGSEIWLEAKVIVGFYTEISAPRIDNRLKYVKNFVVKIHIKMPPNFSWDDYETIKDIDGLWIGGEAYYTSKHYLNIPIVQLIHDEVKALVKRQYKGQVSVASFMIEKYKRVDENGLEPDLGPIARSYVQGLLGD